MEPQKLNLDCILSPSAAKDAETTLRALVAQLENKAERYDLSWNGKARAAAEAGLPIHKTLRPDEKESVHFDTTGNLFITGDNLDALKLLQESYLGKIDVIYIDPPYNTGKDFVYRDRFSKTMAEAVEESRDENGERQYTINSKDNGRFHSVWLSMMYPRLKLARNLLKDTGVIFISIDDNEQANLKLLCDEVFGEGNFVGQWNWFKSETPPNLSKTIKKNIEYVLCYEKQNDGKKFFGLQKESKSDDPFTKPQNSIKELRFPTGSINIKSNEKIIKKGIFGTERFPNELLNDIDIENGKNKNEARFKNKFIWLQEKLIQELENGTIVNLSKNGVLSYKKANYDPETPPNFIDAEVGSTNEKSQKELDDLLGGKYFDHPKPTELLEYLFNFQRNNSALILDFFSGSGTTAHAVMKLNAEDGGNRKYILCTLDEPTPEDSEARKAGYLTIDQISRERIRRAAAKIAKENPLLAKTADFGFRALKIADTNFADVRVPANELKQGELLDAVNNVKAERTPLDLLFGVFTALALEYNRELKTEILPAAAATPNTVYYYDYLGENSGLLACFDENLPEDVIRKIAAKKPLCAVFRETAFKQSCEKVNAHEIFKPLSPDTKIKII